MKKIFFSIVVFSLIMPCRLHAQTSEAKEELDKNEAPQLQSPVAENKQEKPLINEEEKNPKEKKSYASIVWLLLGTGIGALLGHLFSEDTIPEKNKIPEDPEKEKDPNPKKSPSDEDDLKEKRKVLSQSEVGKQILQTMIEAFQDDDKIEALMQLDEVKQMRHDGTLKRILERFVELKNQVHDAQGQLFAEASVYINKYFKESDIDGAPLPQKIKKRITTLSAYGPPIPQI